MGRSVSAAPAVRPLPGSPITICREPNTGPGLPPSVESAHPSPMPAECVFLRSRPFSRADDLLIRQGGRPVDRRLP